MASPLNGLEPVVLDGIRLDTYIQLLLEHHATPSTLLVCSTHDAFVQQLLHATAQTPSADGQPHPLLIRTLRMISQSRTLQVAFCPSLDVTRAFLSTHVAQDHAQSGSKPATGTRQPLLAILDLLNIHRETSSWSAQGLSQTFAIAVEAAHRSGERLVIAECAANPALGDDEGHGRTPTRDPEDGDQDRGAAREEQEDDIPVQRLSVWEEQVAILNVSTKSFGAGERGWAGRTVEIKKVAERWCVVKKVESNSDLA